MHKPTQGRRRYAVFDLDGTLVDSLPDLAIALNKLLAEHGRRRLADDEVRVMVGDGAARLVERAFAAAGGLPAVEPTELVVRFLDLYEGNAADNTRPWPGVPEALQALADAGWRMAVCTNKPYRPTVEILEALGLAPLFAAVSGGDSLPWKKPDPRHVLGTLEALGATPAEAVFVGDSQNDAQAAQAAGLPVVLVTFGYTRVPVIELGADALIDDFAALPAALSRLDSLPGRQI